MTAIDVDAGVLAASAAASAHAYEQAIVHVGEEIKARDPSNLTALVGSLAGEGPYAYTILPAISGNKNVGAGGDYTTITAALAALNGAEITAPVTLTLTDATYPTETQTSTQTNCRSENEVQYFPAVLSAPRTVAFLRERNPKCQSSARSSDMA